MSKPPTCPVGVQQRDVGDAADVDHRPIFTGRAKGGGMERRHQWRCFTTGGHVATAEVGHHVDARGFGDATRVPDLDGVGQRLARPVQYGLAMAADGAHVSCGQCRIAAAMRTAAAPKSSPIAASSAPNSSRSQRAGSATPPSGAPRFGRIVDWIAPRTLKRPPEFPAARLQRRPCWFRRQGRHRAS